MRRLSGRRPSARLILAFALAGSILPLMPTPAQAAQAATASVDRTVSYRGQSNTFTFTLTNSSTAGEAIPSVRIGRPSTDYTITDCPEAPAGWTAAVWIAPPGGPDGDDSPAFCKYDSAAGSGDDIAASGTATFKVTASIASGDASVAGVSSWPVEIDSTDTFDILDGSVMATGSGGALTADFYGIELTDVVVENTPSTAGDPCPAANKTGPAGGTRALTVCGTVHTASSFNAEDALSGLSGTFVSTSGSLQGGAVSSGSTNAVLATYPNATLNAAESGGLDVQTFLEAAGSMSSPSITFSGYSTDGTPPPDPAAPDLAAGSDSGASSTDDITNDNTPTFVGTAEAGATVELIVGGTVRDTTTAAGDGSYSLTIPGGSPLGDGARSITVRATDQYGNASGESPALAVTIDTGTPADPTIDTEPGVAGTDPTPTWTFSGELGGQFTCTLVHPDTSQTVDNACASPKTFDLSSAADGGYTFRVSQTDVAGNVSGESTDGYLLDRQAPADPTISTRPAETTSNPSVQWTFSGEAGTTFECVLVRPDSSQAVDPNCVSAKSYNLTTRPDGLYTFRVRQTDAAGLQSGYTDDTFTLDRVAPVAPTITAEPPLRTNDATPTWNFTGEPGGSFECVLEKPGGAQVTDPSCAGPKTYDLSSDADGLYTFSVRQTDAAGSPGPYATSTFTLDRQAPVAPSITARPANVTSDQNPQWTFTGELGSSYECVLVRPDTTEITSVPCFSPKTFGLAGEPDGAYTFKVRQTDMAGNPGPYATDDFTLDRQPPAAPTITSEPPVRTNNPAVQWGFTGEASATFECVLVKPDLTEVTDTSCTSPKAFDLSGESDGTYTFKVRQKDLANLQSPFATDTFTLDRQAPPAPTFTAQPVARTNDETPVWNFTGEALGVFECELTKPGGAQVTDPNCSGPKTYNLASDGDGLYTFRVRQTDQTGNVGPYATSTFTLDRQAPAAPSITGRPANVTANENPQWTFTGELGASFECVLVRPDTTEMTSIPCFSPTSFSLIAELDGDYTFKVRQIDVAGNPGPYALDAFELDRVVPGAPSIDSRPPDVTSNPTVQWSFSGEANAVFECVLTRPNLTEITDPGCTSPKTYDLSSEADGNYLFKVRQTDEAGHQSVFATDSFRLDRQAPVAPTITAQPAAQSSDATPDWNFTGEAGGVFECVLIKPGGAQVSDPNCTGPKSYNFTSEVDGLYTFRVRQIDAASNAGPFATSTYTLDRVAPAAPVIGTRPNNSTNDSDPIWTFTGEFGASYECILVRPNLTQITSIPCGSPAGFDLNSEPDGNYTFRVRQLDMAGNPGPYVSDDFTLDRVAPDPPDITSRPPTFTSNPNPQWTFTGDGNAAFECVLVHPDGTEVEIQPCATPRSFNLTAQPDGTYTFKVLQRDDAGNKSVYTTDTFTLDRAAPVAPTITAAPPNRSNDDTPTWSYSGEFGGIYECVLTKPGGAQVVDANCVSAKNYNVTGDVDGLYTFRVRQTDAAGNTGPYATSTYTLDRVAPVAPTITSEPPTRTNDDTPAWAYTGEAGGTYECVVVKPGGAQLVDPSCTSPKGYDFTGDVDGLYTFRVRQTDVAGNTGPYATDTFTLDRVAPVPPTITSEPPTRTNDDTPTWSYTGEAGGTYECVIIKPGGAQVVDASCVSSKTFDLTGDVDGLYTFRVRQTDVAGNTGLYATDTFTLDRVAPVPPTITSEPPTRTNDDTPTWGFSGEAGGTYECVIIKPGGAQVVDASCVSSKTFDLTGDVDGLYTFRVRQTDVAGNTGLYVTVTYTLDREPPVAPAITGRPANVTADEDPDWTFTGEWDATFECVLVRPDTTEVTTAPCTSPATFPLSAELDGDYTFKVRQIDSAGNPGPYETDTFELDRVPPVEPSIDSRPPDDVNDDVLEWTFSGEVSAVFECVLVRPDLTEIVDADCDSPKTLDIGSELDGTYTFKVRQIDEAGHPSPYITDTFTFDRVAPVPPSIDLAPPARTNDSTPEWEFSGEGGGTYECVLVRPDGTETGPANCSSPRGYSLSKEPDGDYTFKVRQTDDAGNVGEYATSSITLDRQRPGSPMFTSLPPNRTANNSPRWTFVGEANATFECVLLRVDGSEVSDPACTSPKIFSMVGEQDGDFTVKVRQTDVAGNVSAFAVDNFTLDRQAPADLMITSEPPPFTPNPAPEWDFEGEPGGSFECILERPDRPQLNTQNCTAPKSYSLQGDPDGLYTFKVRQIDSAFNRSEWVTSSFTLDRADPVAPTITDRPADRTTDDTPEWTFTGEQGASFECHIVLPTGGRIDAPACGSPRGFDLTNEEDGTYTFKVRQLDSAGNPGPYETDTFTLDRRPPDAPTFVETPDADTKDPLVSWDFTGETGGSFECTLVKPGDVLVTTSNCIAPSDYDLSGDPDGTYTFMVRQTDDVNNVGPYATSSVRLDRQAPAAPSVTSTPEHFYDVTPEWEFAGEAGGSYECVLVKPNATDVNVDACSSPADFDLSSAPDGNYVFKVRQTDAAGNVGEFVTEDHYFNKTPPTPTLGGGAPALTNDTTHEVTITGEDEAVFECTLLKPNGAKVVDADCISPYQLDLTTGPDGEYTFSVRQFIGVNPSLSATQTFTLDTTAERPALEVKPGIAGSDATPTWTFDGEAGATFECVLEHPDGTQVTENDCQDPKQPTLDDEPDGDYSFRVRQIDPAGNVSAFAGKRYLLDRVAPSAPSIRSKPRERTSDVTPKWAFAGEDAATFICTLTAPNGDVKTDRNCPEPKEFALKNAEGRYRFAVAQRDLAGNVGPTSTHSFKLDLTAPRAKRLRVGPKKFVPGSRIGIKFGRSEPAKAVVKVTRNGKTLKTFKKSLAKKRVTVGWRSVRNGRPVKPGIYKVVVKLKDRARLTSQVKVKLQAQPPTV